MHDSDRTHGVFENRDESRTEEWRNLHSKDLNNLHSSHSIVKVIK